MNNRNAPWRKPTRAILELLVLATAAWIATILVQENPSHGLNVPYFGAKWIFYTYVLAAAVFVAIPILATAVIAALVALVRQRRPKSLWAVYRAGSALVAVWMVLGLYGLWYVGAHPT